MQAIVKKLCTTRKAWDEFWRREDEKYFADPVAYQRQMDRFFARLPIFLIAGTLVWVGWEMLK